MIEYQAKRPPWTKQGEALEKMAGKKNFALLMAMRTGKSYVLITDFGRLELAGEVDDLLVVAPAGVYETWRTQLEDHASLDLSRRLLTYIWRPGATSLVAKKRIRTFVDYRDGPRALIIDVEAFSSVKAARDLCLEFARQRRCLGAVDESTTIKNHESNRGEFVIDKLSPLLSHRRILCGLPTPRNPLDLFGQFAFLDRSILGFANYKSFEARYAKVERVCMLPDRELRYKLKRLLGGQERWKVEGLGTVSMNDLPRQALLAEIERRNKDAPPRLRTYVQTIPVLKGFQNEEELQKKIAPHSYRCLLTDCYDVPPKLYSFRDVEMTPEQRRVYKELKEMACAELDSQSHVTALHVITKILRLHQVLCGHVRDDEEKIIKEIPENRTSAVIDILDEYDGKSIVWCSYDYNVQKIAKAIEKKFNRPVARFWGGNRNTREAEERMFKQDRECRDIVATPSAGGKGRTWTEANLLVYLSNTNNLEHRSQSEERGDGNMKMDRIACVDLRVKGTVDEKIIWALRGKIDMAAKITGDSWREWLV